MWNEVIDALVDTIPLLIRQMSDREENLYPTILMSLVRLSFSANYSTHEKDTHPYKTLRSKRKH